MKILIFVGVIFAVLTLMKAYVYMRFMQHSAMINKCLGLGFLVLLATGGEGFTLCSLAVFARRILCSARVFAFFSVFMCGYV